MSMNPLDKLAEHAEWCVARARRLGADEAIVHISESLSRSVQCRGEAIEELAHEHEQGLALTVYCDKRSGSASVSEWSEKALGEAVDAALAAARYTQGDPDFGLPEPQYYAQVDAHRQAALKLHDPEEPALEALIDCAQACEQAALDQDARIVSGEGASAAHVFYQRHIATSNGFAHGSRSSRSSVSLSVLARENDSQQSDYDYDYAVAWQGLRTPQAVGAQAARRAVAALHPRAIVPGRYPVILDARMAAGLLGSLLQALNGRAQYRNLSFLAGKLGEKILPEWLSLVERPHLPGFLASAWYDDEGVATRESAVIEQGRIARYLLGHYSARRLAMTPTGNAGGVRNLAVIGDDAHVRGADALRRDMGTGLLITRMMGHGANILTGDYSRGAAGFWVEGGEIVHPVEGITLAGRLQDMLANIVAIGDDVDWRGHIHAPSLLLDALTVAQ